MTSTSKWIEEDEFTDVEAGQLFSLKKPRDVRAGCASGLKSFGKGLLGGCLGVLVAPVMGAMTSSTALQQELDQEEEEKKKKQEERAQQQQLTSEEDDPWRKLSGFC